MITAVDIGFLASVAAQRSVYDSKCCDCTDDLQQSSTIVVHAALTGFGMNALTSASIDKQCKHASLSKLTLKRGVNCTAVHRAWQFCSVQVSQSCCCVADSSVHLQLSNARNFRITKAAKSFLWLTLHCITLYYIVCASECLNLRCAS